ncbi:MAG: UvrD-helicase domain-containing protein, partial [Ruminococcus sp.]|nr:UvrD-helicase domain-containing protein [Ruminococcus sp.]
RELTEAMTDPENEEDTAYISEQLSLIPTANISTIHSFCFRLIRENAGILGIDPGFGITEPSDEETLVIKAIDNVFDHMYDDRRAKLEKLLSVFCPNDKDPSGLKDIIRRLRVKLLALPFPEVFAERRTENYYKGASDNDEIMKAYAEQVFEELKKAHMFSQAAVEYVEKNRRNIPEKKYDDLLKAVKLDNSVIADVVGRYAEKKSSPMSVLDAEDIYFEKYTVCSFTLDDGTDGHDVLKKELIDKYRSICSDYLNVYICKKGTETRDEKTPKSLFTISQIKSDYRIHAEISEMLFEVTSLVREEEKKLKAERNVLGFSDAEQYACELLCQETDDIIVPSPLALELQNKYKLIMVDEFQDSTKIQEIIFRMISNGGTAEKAGNNFFAVGDIKQSIYRFRAAEPSLFERNLKNDELKKVYLNRNYRSASPVVELVNRAFGKIMSVNNGGIDYGKNDALIFGETEQYKEPTEIITVSAGMAERFDDDYQKAEAEAVALRIRKMLDNGIRPSEICLLMRANRQMKAFAESFSRYDIPFEYSASDSILKTGEVRTILDILRVIDNPTLDIPFAAVLMSPLFAFTADDLAEIRLADRTQTLYGDLLLYSEYDNALAEQCREFRDMFSNFREYAMTHTSGELTDYICQKTFAASVFSVFPDGAQKVANIRKFTAAASAFDANSSGAGRSIGSFVRRMNVLVENNSDLAGEDISSG